MRWKIFRVEDGSFVGSDNHDVNGLYIYLVPVLAYGGCDMTQFLAVCGEFVLGLFSLDVPGLGISFLQLMLGFWTLVAVGWLFKRTFLGDD